MASGVNSRGEGCENNDPHPGTMVGQGQFFIYLPKRVDGKHYVRTPVKVKAEMILSPKHLDDENLASIVIPCRARAEKLSKDNILSVINVPIKIEAELLLTPDMSFSCKPPTSPHNNELLESATKTCGRDLRRARSTSTAAEDEKDVPMTSSEKQIDTDDSKSAVAVKTSRAEVPFVTFKNEGFAETYPASHRCHHMGLLLPMRTLKEPSELTSHLQPDYQRAVVTKRREPTVCQREQIFAQRKLEREKQMKNSNESGRKKNNLYLQQYLRRESLSKQSIAQDAEAVRRRETLMKELGLKLKDELGMRQVHRFIRNIPVLRSNSLNH